ncbi:hypothetical protein [Alteromonas lipolytica]|uniref:Lipoprotein n=1 Tax=Alteromonas lipolytica TaxID=1856405 RepID=A0A1E8FGT1_9ALTE|nr:hypothetical protein [Alteromonas lipolytica]OFI35119.1 hypothetical protein BFC17_16360 [Alteromonas lipolytica]GGF56853.1 hypothetical protein GCM10011338_06390 [Alteromonas lipolytica]
MLKHTLLVATITTSLQALTGCASQSNLCEDILEIKAQNQQCKVLQKAIQNPKNPQMALTARQRYENECVNFRFYRDDYDTVCKKGEEPISQPVPSTPTRDN